MSVIRFCLEGTLLCTECSSSVNHVYKGSKPNSWMCFGCYHGSDDYLKNRKTTTTKDSTETETTHHYSSVSSYHSSYFDEFPFSYTERQEFLRTDITVDGKEAFILKPSGMVAEVMISETLDTSLYLWPTIAYAIRRNNGKLRSRQAL